VSLIDVSPQPRRWISLTPLIDVVFILLMFFMLSTQFYRTGVLNVAVSSSSTSSVSASQDSVVRLRVHGDGTWQVGEESYAFNDSVSLEQITKNQSVFLEADDSAVLQDLITFLDRLAIAGVSDVNWLPLTNSSQGQQR